MYRENTYRVKKNHIRSKLWIVIVFAIFLILGIFYFTRPASVNITAFPKGSKITLGKYYGVDKLSIKEIKPGEYNLEVSRKGFKSHKEKIKIRARQKFTKKISLKPLFFNLKIDSEPAGADYEIILSDASKRKGETPFEEKVPAGKLKIKLLLSGYNILEEEIFLDEKKEQTFYLDRKGQLVHHVLNIESIPSPKGVAFTPDGKEIWVTSLLNKNKGASVYSLEGKKISDIYLDGGGGVEVIFSANGKKAYISQMETARVYEIDSKSKKVLRKFDTESSWTKILALSHDGKILFASNWSGNNISEINIKSGKLRRNIPSVATPRGIYPTKDGRFLYVAGFDKGEIQKINLSTGKGKVVFKSGGAMRHIVANENKGVLYISDMAKNVIWKLDLETDKVLKFVDTENNPNTIALSPNKKVLFVSCRGENASSENYYIPGPEWGSVLIFDAESGKMLDAIVGGDQPTALDVSRNGKYLLFSDFLDGRLELFDVPSYNFLKKGKGGRGNVYKRELKK